ncbi:response regulator [Desemzia sp. FAM 24101]|uniref:response regulator n=1 Tax=unclassified Desemzia TaxID=2685243 RepID=UPI003887114B
MFKVLIVDDHLDQRELINYLMEKHRISWQVHEASNGKEALAVFSEHKFDLLITDIQMPFVSGIELVEQIRKNDLSIPTLFISGYEDFSYAKKAIDLQAVNYLLKPINPKEFHDQLDKLEQLIIKNKFIEKTHLYMEKQDVLIKILKGTPMNKLSEIQQKLTLPLLTKITYLLVIDFNEPKTERLEHFLRLHTNNSITFVRTSLSQVVCFLQVKDRKSALEKKELIYNQIQSEIQSEVTIELSEQIENQENIYTAYQQLIEKLNQKFYQKEANPLLLLELPTHNRETEQQLINQLKETIYHQDLKRLKHILYSLFNQFDSASIESPSIVRFFFGNLYRILVEVSEINPAELRSDIKVILESQEFKQIPISFEHLLSQINLRFINLNDTTNYYIRETKNYMMNHYQEELSLDTLAKNVHLAPKYLSKLFKSEENVGINQFLNEIRIEKAKELLLSFNYRVSDIGRLIGFNSQSYFIKSFQKYTGMTPDRFRKTKGGLDEFE